MRKPHPEALYFYIAKDAARHARSLVGKTTGEDVIARKQQTVTAMVFSALCLEVFVTHEYELLLGERVAKELARLSVEKRWILLPELVADSNARLEELLSGDSPAVPVTFSQGAEPFQTFREIFSTRNRRLVHVSPSGEAESGLPSGQRVYWGDFIDDVDRAEKYVACIPLIIDELHRLTRGRSRKADFLNNTRYVSEIVATVSIGIDSGPPRTAGK